MSRVLDKLVLQSYRVSLLPCVQSLASYIIRKGAIHLVSSPLTSVVPFAPLLFSVRGGHNLAAPFMAPYYLMKGLPSPDEQVSWLLVVWDEKHFMPQAATGG